MQSPTGAGGRGPSAEMSLGAADTSGVNPRIEARKLGTICPWSPRRKTDYPARHDEAIRGVMDVAENLVMFIR